MNELKHYGVKGMKWGVRKERETSNTRRGKKSIDKSDENTHNYDKKKRRDKLKKAIKIGAIAAATGLAVYGYYKVVDSGDLHRLIEKGKIALGKSDSPFLKDESLAGAKSANRIFVEIVDRINEGAGSIFNPGSYFNCLRCTFAYELNRRGYRVKATKSVFGRGQDIFGINEAMSRGDKIKHLKNIIKSAIQGDENARDWVDSTYDKELIKTYGSTPEWNIYKALEKNPNGARGNLNIFWEKGLGHSLAWEIINGKPVIFDCQMKNLYRNPRELYDLTKHGIVDYATFQRLDNAELDYNFLLKWCKNDYSSS